MIWFLIFIGLQCITIGVHAAKHGEATRAKYNVWERIINLCLVLAFVWAWGGFDVLFGGQP